MGLEIGPGTKPAAASQRRQDGHLQTLEFATFDEHTSQVDAGEDESDARGTRLSVLSQGIRTGGSGIRLFWRTTKRERESAPHRDPRRHQKNGDACGCEGL